MDNPIMPGDHVQKVTGDYKFIGVVVARFTKLSGLVRIVAENSDGILHIFSEKQLRIKDEKRLTIGTQSCNKRLNAMQKESETMDELTAPGFVIDDPELELFVRIGQSQFVDDELYCDLEIVLGNKYTVTHLDRQTLMELYKVITQQMTRCDAKGVLGD